MVPNTSELLPEPETPVDTVSLRLGSSMLTSLRLFSRAPSTRIRSWLSAMWSATGWGCFLFRVGMAARLVLARRVRFFVPDRFCRWRAVDDHRAARAGPG